MSKSKPQTASWKERRRFHTIELKGKGWKQREIATALDVSEGAVRPWLRKWTKKEKQVYVLVRIRADHWWLEDCGVRACKTS